MIRDVTRRGINIARNNLGIDRELFRTALLDTTNQVEQAYLDLIYTRQYIDVVDLPNGDYVLETIADPDNKLVESNEHNNCGTVLIRLTNMGTANHHAEIIGAGPGCTT